MRRRPGFWDLAGAGLATGAVAVWAFAWAARVGVLRLVLELFPRATWDGVTWALIPALLLLPMLVPGLAAAALARAGARDTVRAAAGGVAGSFVAAPVFWAALVLGLGRLSPPAAARLARALPSAAAPVLAVLVAAGWFVITSYLLRRRWLRAASLPLAGAAVLLVWLAARHEALAIAYVLDRPEMEALFVCVAIGGALGGAGALSVGRAARSERAADEAVTTEGGAGAGRLGRAGRINGAG
jgi:hypothetical protein